MTAMQCGDQALAQIEHVVTRGMGNNESLNVPYQFETARLLLPGLLAEAGYPDGRTPMQPKLGHHQNRLFRDAVGTGE